MASDANKHKFSHWMSTQVADKNWTGIESHFNEGEFAKHMGLHISLDNPSVPKCYILTPQPFHFGGVGQDYVNGAVIAAMFDFVIGLTALTYASHGNFATTNVNIKYAKPVKLNGVLVTAECTRKIGRTLFVEATLFTHGDEPCCFAHGEVRTGIK